MQLPSCENDLNKTGCVDPATERPGQTEDLFTGQSQTELTYLFAHFPVVFPLPAFGQVMARSKPH